MALALLSRISTEVTSHASEYEPGMCNIGPAEVARRRRAGHIGFVVTVAVFAVLVYLDVPPLARFLVALPAAMAASGYLQAWFRFCVAFASLGIFNFGERGQSERVADPLARARDRARVRQMALAVALISVAVGTVAVLLPV